MPAIRLLAAALLSMLAITALTSCVSDDGGSDADGEQPTPLDPFNAAVLDLSGRTDVPAEEITLISAESVDWPDACLGLPQPDEVCAEVITPGNRVVLEAEGVQYLYRTDQVTHARFEGEVP